MDNLTPRAVVLTFPDSVWGSDIVLFYVPAVVSDIELVDELIFQHEELDIDSFDSMPDMVDNLLQSVADHFDGRYRYLPIAGTVSITLN